MHADHRRGLYGVCAVDEIEMNHRIAFVCFTLAARLHASLTTDATVGIDEELVLFRYGHGLVMIFD
jgi:hypothetical protein